MSPLVDEFHAGGPPPRAPRSRFLALPLALALIAGAAGVLVLRSSPSAEAQVFRHAFQAGETRTYQMTMDLTATPEGIPDTETIEGSVQATMRMTVVSSYEDGSGVVEIDISDVRMEPAQPGVPTELGTLRVTVDPDGSISDVEGAGGLLSMTGVDPMSGFTSGGGSDASSSQFFFPQYPADAIAPGDTWSESTTVPLPFGDDQLTIDVGGELLGYEGTRYGRAARLGYDIDMPMDMSFSMQELFDAMLAFTREFGPPGEAVSPPPAEFRDARFVFSGGMQMNAESLVIPDTSDLVQLDGTADMRFTVKLEGVPDGLLGDSNEMTIDAELKMSMVRVDRTLAG